MKNIYKFLALAFVVVFAVACSDDKDNQNANGLQNGVTVLSAQTYLTAKGDSGYLVLQTPATRITSNAQWLSTTVKNDTVYLVPQVNNSVKSRSTEVQLQNAQGGITTISVTQEGFTFAFNTGTELLASNADTTAVYELRSNLPLAVQAKDSWITPTFNNNTLRVNVAQNTTGIPRVSYVVFSSGSQKDSLRVVQASKEDILGSYNLTARRVVPGSAAQDGVFPVRIEDAQGDSVTVVIQNTFRWKGVYTGGGEITLRMGQSVYTNTNSAGVSTYYLTGVVTTDGRVVYSSNVTTKLKLNDQGRFVFVNDGSLSTAREGWWAFMVSTTPVATNGSVLGVGMAFATQVLRRAE